MTSSRVLSARNSAVENPPSFSWPAAKSLTGQANMTTTLSAIHRLIFLSNMADFLPQESRTDVHPSRTDPQFLKKKYSREAKGSSAHCWVEWRRPQSLDEDPRHQPGRRAAGVPGDPLGRPLPRPRLGRRRPPRRSGGSLPAVLEARLSVYPD